MQVLILSILITLFQPYLIDLVHSARFSFLAPLTFILTNECQRPQTLQLGVLLSKINREMQGQCLQHLMSFNCHLHSRLIIIFMSPIITPPRLLLHQ